MERGEVEGASSSWAAVIVTKQDWLREKKIRIILQTQPERHPDLPDRRASPNTATRPRTGCHRALCQRQRRRAQR